MTEFQLQVNLVERMARIEEKIDHLTGLMPLLENHSERITRAEESGKSSRRRIEELEELVGEIEEKIDKAKKELGYNQHSFIEGIQLLEKQISNINS